MIIIGSDVYPTFQEIALLDDGTGEYQELQLGHDNGEAERFYRQLHGQSVRVAIEASGHSR